MLALFCFFVDSLSPVVLDLSPWLLLILDVIANILK